MAKKKDNNIIALEIEKFEEKINEFQTYLEVNNINRVGEYEDDGKKYKEIETQLKIMAALPALLEALKRLREVSQERQMETRGDVDIPDAWRSLNK